MDKYSSSSLVAICFSVLFMDVNMFVNVSKVRKKEEKKKAKNLFFDFTQIIVQLLFMTRKRVSFFKIRLLTL